MKISISLYITTHVLSHIKWLKSIGVTFLLHKSMKIIILITLNLLILFSPFKIALSESLQTDTQSLEQIKQNVVQSLILSENYYWLSVDEGINTLMYYKGRQYINNVKKQLEQLPDSEQDFYDRNLLSVQYIEQDMDQLLHFSEIFMNGFFSMLKYISTSFFFFPEKSERHTLMKPPELIAANMASESLLGSIMTDDFLQVHTFINVSSLNSSLTESMVFDIFNKENKFYVLHHFVSS